MKGIQCIGGDGSTYDLRIEGVLEANWSVRKGMSIGETTAQNQTFLLVAHKGEFKEFPLLGVGIEDMVNDHDFEYWKREITRELKNDGQHIDVLEIDENSLRLEAHYIR